MAMFIVIVGTTRFICGLLGIIGFIIHILTIYLIYSIYGVIAAIIALPLLAGSEIFLMVETYSATGVFLTVYNSVIIIYVVSSVVLMIIFNFASSKAEE